MSMSSGPTTWFQGTTSPDGDRVGPDSLWGRLGTVAVAFLVFPFATLVAVTWFVLFQYARLPWWVPAPVGAVLGVVGVAVSPSVPAWAVGHLSTSVDAVRLLLPNSSGSLGQWWADNGWGWLGQQVLFAGFSGSLVAAAIAGWVWWRRPRWEQRLLRPGPVLKARARKTAAAIAAGADAPTDGVTVGVALDRRDPRFAGGKPGAPYGRRAVLRDSEGAGHCLIVGGSGSGKALDVGTLIPLAGGGFRAIGELRVGDQVLDEFSQPTTVVGAFDPMVGHECVEVRFEDESSVVADVEHLWRARFVHGGTGEPAWQVVSTAELMNPAVDVGGGTVAGWWEVPEVTWEGRVVHPVRRVTQIRSVQSRPVRCIAVDSVNKVFLAGPGMVPTHNTTTMLMGARDVIRRGHGLVVVDCKGGPDVPDQIADWAAMYGRRFHHWSMFDSREPYDGPAEGPGFYDPISRGDASRRKDLLIGSQRWDVEYYKTVIGDYLQTMFKVMDLVPAPEKDTFQDVADLLSPNALIARASSLPREQYPELTMALQRIGEMGDQERSGVNNMYARLNTLTASIAGEWMRRDPRGRDNINIEQVARRGEVVVFSLDTSNYEETSALLAGLIVQDLKTVSSILREDPPDAPLHVYIDEFSAVDATNIYGLLAKARDARMPVTLATQALADLKRRDPHFDAQVVGIVSSFLIHRANSEIDARVYAGLSGLDTRMTHRLAMENTTGVMGGMGAAAATGSGFLQEEEKYRVNPGVFQRLDQGQCVMIAKIPQDRYISPVQVIKEDPAVAATKHSPALHPLGEPNLASSLDDAQGNEDTHNAETRDTASPHAFTGAPDQPMDTYAWPSYPQLPATDRGSGANNTGTPTAANGPAWNVSHSHPSPTGAVDHPLSTPPQAGAPLPQVQRTKPTPKKSAPADTATPHPASTPTATDTPMAGRPQRPTRTGADNSGAPPAVKPMPSQNESSDDSTQWGTV